MLSDISMFKKACLGARECEVQSQGQTASVMSGRNMIISSYYLCLPIKPNGNFYFDMGRATGID